MINGTFYVGPVYIFIQVFKTFCMKIQLPKTTTLLNIRLTFESFEYTYVIN